MKDKHKKRKQEIRDELAGLSPLLSKLKDKGEETPFKVPEHYFTQLPDQLADRLKREGAFERESAKRPWRIGIFLQELADQAATLFQPRLALALASLLVVIVAAWLWTRQGSPERNDLDFAALSVEEIQRYIDNHLHDFDEETVMKVAQDNGSIKLSPAVDIESNELDQYLDQFIDDMDPMELEELF